MLRSVKRLIKVLVLEELLLEEEPCEEALPRLDDFRVLLERREEVPEEAEELCLEAELFWLLEAELLSSRRSEPS